MLANIDTANTQKSMEVTKEVLKEYLNMKIIEKSEGMTRVLATNEISIISVFRLNWFCSQLHLS
jgi:hypothetical protein